MDINMTRLAELRAARAAAVGWTPPKITTALAKSVAKVVDKHWAVTGVKTLDDIRDAIGKGVATEMSMSERVDNQDAIKKWKAGLSKDDLHKLYRMVETIKNGKSNEQYRRTDEALKGLKAAAPKYANSADMREAARTAATGGYARDMLFSVVDRKGLSEVQQVMKKAGDEQSVTLIREVQMELIQRLSLDQGGDSALSRLAGLASRGKTWDPALIRNNVFKVANSLGMHLPSGMFASQEQ